MCGILDAGVATAREGWFLWLALLAALDDPEVLGF
jgi:hypothetical protein